MHPIVVHQSHVPLKRDDTGRLVVGPRSWDQLLVDGFCIILAILGKGELEYRLEHVFVRKERL